MKRKTIFFGLLTGLLVTFPVMAVMYLAHQVFGAPFAPYDIFNWLSGVLPGPVVTFGIDLIIDTLRFFGMNVASTAKTAERLMALSLFSIIGALGGGVHFYLARYTKLNNKIITLMTVLIAGAPIIILSLIEGETTFSPVGHFLWLGMNFLVWGWAVNGVHRQFQVVSAEIEEDIRQSETSDVQKISRRTFLITLGGTSAAITVIGAGLGSVLGAEEEPELESDIEETPPELPLFPLPNANDPVVPVPGTRPEYTPLEDHFRVFIGLEPLDIDEKSWRLPITGLVNRPLLLTLDELRSNYPVRHQFVTLRCISGRVGTNLISTTLWTGASLQDILADADIQEEGRYLILTCGDGYYETINLNLITKDPRIMLTYNWDGKPLPKDHGFPLRVWIPNVYGMKQPKWITGIEVVNHFQDGYWVERGWDIFARVNTTSVIDTVAVKSIIERDGQRLIPIGGIAYSGARGISKVEIQVDEGEWQQAQLREPLSETTWVIWRFEWPYQEGRHTFSVRCYEGDGTPQILEKSRLRPRGATGMHSVEKDI